MLSSKRGNQREERNDAHGRIEKKEENSAAATVAAAAAATAAAAAAAATVAASSSTRTTISDGGPPVKAWNCHTDRNTNAPRALAIDLLKQTVVTTQRAGTVRMYVPPLVYKDTNLPRSNISILEDTGASTTLHS
jgi:hypothetical protein